MQFFRDRELIVIFLMLFTLCNMVEAAESVNIDMHSTSSMRDKQTYRSSYGRQYTGSFYNSGKTYNPQKLSTISSSKQHSYGYNMYGYNPTSSFSASPQRITPNTVTFYPIVNNTTKAKQSSTYNRHLSLRAPGVLDDGAWRSWYDEYISDGGNENLDGLEDWWSEHFGNDDSVTPDIFDDWREWLENNQPWLTPVGDYMCLILLVMFYTLLLIKNNVRKGKLL